MSRRFIMFVNRYYFKIVIAKCLGDWTASEALILQAVVACIISAIEAAPIP